MARSAVCLLVAAALAGPASAVARESDRAQDVWEVYRLRDAPQPAAGGSAPASTRSGETATGPSDKVERLALASVLALIAGGLTTWLVTLPRPLAPLAASPAMATPPDAESPSLPPPPPAPPEPDRAWAAEIGWHLGDGESRFSVVARPVDGDAEPITLGASSLLEWPPRGARSVQALTDAVKALESTLVAAGWTPLPRGGAWYAKRFTWRPGARGERAAGMAPE
jgi:hypothetical protein